MKKTKQPEYEKAILSAKKQFIAIAGKATWERECEFVKLFPISTCDPDSIKQSILNVAYTGITLNPIFKESYLIEKDGKCFLDFTYRGLIKIATSEGAVTSLSANVVYSWDQFSCEQGTNARIHYVQNFFPATNAKDVAPTDPTVYPAVDPDELARNPKLIWQYSRLAFSIARLPNGTEDFVILPKWKLLKTWNNTERNFISESWPEEWIRKTAIRYHSKTLPRAQKLVTAVSIVNEHEGIKRNKKSESVLIKRMKK